MQQQQQQNNGWNVTNHSNIDNNAMNGLAGVRAGDSQLANMQGMLGRTALGMANTNQQQQPRGMGIPQSSSLAEISLQQENQQQQLLAGMAYQPNQTASLSQLSSPQQQHNNTHFSELPQQNPSFSQHQEMQRNASFSQPQQVQIQMQQNAAMQRNASFSQQLQQQNTNLLLQQQHSSQQNFVQRNASFSQQQPQQNINFSQSSQRNASFFQQPQQNRMEQNVSFIQQQPRQNANKFAQQLQRNASFTQQQQQQQQQNIGMQRNASVSHQTQRSASFLQLQQQQAALLQYGANFAPQQNTNFSQHQHLQSQQNASVSQLSSHQNDSLASVQNGNFSVNTAGTTPVTQPMNPFIAAISAKNSSGSTVIPLQHQQQQLDTFLHSDFEPTSLGEVSDGDLFSLSPEEHSEVNHNDAGHRPQQQQPLHGSAPSPHEQPKSENFSAAESLLHNSCKLYPTTRTVVESALQFDSDAIRRNVPVICTGSDEGGDTNDAAIEKEASKKWIALERYGYPINIALKCKGSLDVLQLLATEGPDILVEKDGPDQSSTLGIALVLDCKKEIIDLCLATNSACAKVSDRHCNLPLHVALRCRKLSLDVINLIHAAYPEAISKRNFHGETPLDVAVRNVFCSDNIVDHLQALAYGDHEANASQYLDDLEDVDA
jgi:hypothetical protein